MNRKILAILMFIFAVSFPVFCQDLDSDDYNNESARFENRLNAAGGFFDGELLIFSGNLSGCTAATIGDLTVTGTITFSGALNTTGDVTHTFDAATDEMDILGTDATGQADTPLINVNDDRTGANANTAGEATIVLDAAGTHSISVTDGVVQFVDNTAGGGAGLTVNNSAADVTGQRYLIQGDYTDNADADADFIRLTHNAGATQAFRVDSDGSIVNAGTITSTGSVDAPSFTSDAGAGLDTQAAGTLVLGASTATKVEIADTGVETEIQGTLDQQEAATFSDATNTRGNVDMNFDAGEMLTIDNDPVGDAGVDLIVIAAANDAVEADNGNILFVDDNRTGTEADVEAEAAVMIDSTGSYALNVVAGRTVLNGTLETDGNVDVDLPATAGAIFTVDTVDVAGAGQTDYPIKITIANNSVEANGFSGILIDDNRAGTEADVAGEAALAIDSTGTFALNIIKGNFGIQETGGAAGTADFDVDGYAQFDGTIDLNGIVDSDTPATQGLVWSVTTQDLGGSAQTAAPMLVTLANNTTEANGFAGLSIDDNRAGTESDAVNEAALLVDAAGSYAISVPAGRVDVDGTVNLADTTAGSDFTAGNSTGNITLTSDNFDVSCTDATDDVFQVLNATGSVVYIDLDLGASDGLTLGNSAGYLRFSVGSDTLAGSPTLAANSVAVGTTGLIFEGATGGGADANELLLTSADPGGDITVTIPATTGTLITTGDSNTVTGTMIADDTVTFGEISDTLTPEAGTSIVGADTLGGDPALPISGIGFGTTGIIWEGSSANGLETLLIAADVTGADKTVTIPNETGTLLTDATVLAGDVTGTSGATVVGNDSHTHGDTTITDITRSVNIPIGSFANTSNSTEFDFVDLADTSPEYDLVNSGLVLAWDDAAAVDTDYAGSSFRVPPDYVSGGSIFVSVTQDAATATIEDIGCRWSLNGGAISAASTTALANQTAIQTVSVTPAGALVAGTVVNFSFNQSDAAADDTVYVHSVEFRYTATQ